MEADNVLTIDSREKLIRLLGDMLDEATDKSRPFIDLTSQSVELHFDSAYTDFDENEELDGHEIVDVEPLCSHEAFTVMERFASSRQGKERDKLLNVLSRRHPFSAFRSEVEHLAILQEWYDFKNKAYEEFAEERLNDVEVDCVDGKIICRNPENIRVIVAGEDDDGGMI